MKKSFWLSLVAVFAAVLLQSCSSATYVVKSPSGEFHYEGQVFESIGAVASANLTAARARQVEAQADLTQAYAEAIKKDPSVVRDIPLPGNPNDSRFVYRGSWEGRGGYAGRVPAPPTVGFQPNGYQFNPGLNAEENSRNLDRALRFSNPGLYRR